MFSLAPTFVSCGLLTLPPAKFLRQTSFTRLRQSHGLSLTISIPSPPCRLRLEPVMRNHRRKGFPSRRDLPKSVENLQKSVISLWQNASSSERFLIFATGLVAATVASITVNVVFHISLVLALCFIPLLLIPIIFTFMASLTAFAFLMFVTGGAQLFFFANPVFVFSILAKAMLPLTVVVGGASLLIRRALGLSSSNDVEAFENMDDDDEYNEGDLERFDRKLRDRQGPRSYEINRWGIYDVVEELELMDLRGYRQLFLKERIDGAALLELTDEDIRKEFSQFMPLGDRMRLARLISSLKKRAAGPN